MIISALNGTYEKKGWANILELIPLCEKIKKLSAVCKICQNSANFTFRTCTDDAQELIGGADMYMPLCRECYNENSKKQPESATNGIAFSNSGSESTDNGENNNAEGFLLNMAELDCSAQKINHESPNAESPDPTIKAANFDDEEPVKSKNNVADTKRKTIVRELEMERQNSDLVMNFQKSEDGEGLRQRKAQ